MELLKAIVGKPVGRIQNKCVRMRQSNTVGLATFLQAKFLGATVKTQNIALDKGVWLGLKLGLFFKELKTWCNIQNLLELPFKMLLELGD